MKLMESVKAIPKTTVMNVAKPVLSFIAGVLLAGAQVLKEDSVLTVSAVAALPPVCGFSALLGALAASVFTEITAGKVASLATAMVVFLTRQLFIRTSRQRYHVIVSAVSAFSYFGCATFAGVSAEADASYYIRIISASLVLAFCTYLTTTAIKSGILAVPKPHLLMLSTLAVIVASAYQAGEFLCLLLSTICTYKLGKEKATLSAAVLSAGLCIGTGEISVFALILPLTAVLFPTSFRLSGKRIYTALYMLFTTLLISTLFSEVRFFEPVIAVVIFMVLPDRALSLAAYETRSNSSSSLRLGFLANALEHFPKFENIGTDERKFENMVQILSLTESEVSEELAPKLGWEQSEFLCRILSKRTGTEVIGNPLPDGAVEVYFPKTARISENTVTRAAEKAGMGKDCELFKTETGGHIRFTVALKPKWRFEAGICQMSAISEEHDEGICGDCAEVWNFGVYSHLIISDGMGTGKEAETVARQLIRSFKNLTEAGYSLESALRLSSEYIRSCQPDESFATLDILSANLMTGEVTIRKCGAVKSYILRNDCITPIPGGGYPIGILEEICLTNTVVKPDSDLTILMMTDGADILGIEKLAEILQEQDSLSTDDLAALITREAYKIQKQNSRDDITIAVIRIAKI